MTLKRVIIRTIESKQANNLLKGSLMNISAIIKGVIYGSLLVHSIAIAGMI